MPISPGTWPAAMPSIMLASGAYLVVSSKLTDGRAGHEAGHSNSRDELDDPAEAEEAEEEEDGAGEEGEGVGDFFVGVVAGALVVDGLDDLAD